MKPAELKKDHPAIYRAALQHFKNRLRNEITFNLLKIHPRKYPKFKELYFDNRNLCECFNFEETGEFLCWLEVDAGDTNFFYSWNNKPIYKKDI